MWGTAQRNEMETGYICIPRKLFESDYWRQSRTYNDGEALLDIILSARFEASEQTARVGGRYVSWGRGEWPASIRFLACRWHWTDKRVRCFLARLRRRGEITTRCDEGCNVIRLTHYDDYFPHSSESPAGHRVEERENEHRNAEMPSAERTPASVHEEVEIMKSCASWRQMVCDRYQLDHQQLLHHLDMFELDCGCRSLQGHTSQADAQTHFCHWLRIQLELRNTQKHSKNGNYKLKPTPGENAAAALQWAKNKAEEAIRETRSRPSLLYEAFSY